MNKNIEPAVIAYPVHSPAKYTSNSIVNDNGSDGSMEDGVMYTSALGDAQFADDTVEMSGNFFSQLDSMIAAVKVESNALDSMKEKLKEVEGLRNQISHFTRRLLDADQANLNLKSNLVKAQELYAEMKKSKMELESSIVPMRQELNRTKEMCNKERQARITAQQQITQMKDQIAQMEITTQTLDRDVKSIPALTESNEILKSDLSALRRRFKDEKGLMQRHIKQLEAQARDAEAVRGAVRELSLKLLDVCNNNSSANAGQGNSSMLQQQQQQQQQRYQQQQQSRHKSSQSYQHTINQSGNSSSGNIYYQTEQQEQEDSQEYEEEEDEYQDDFNQSLLSAVDHEEYTSGMYLEESSVASLVDTSMDSSFRQSKMGGSVSHGSGFELGIGGTAGGEAKKGKKKAAGGARRVVGQQQGDGKRGTMQQLHEPGTNNYKQSQSFNLPRI